MRIYQVILQGTLVAMLTAGSLVMSVPVYAEDISGSVTLKVTKQDVLPLTAQSGDMLMLVESHGINKSSNWMADAEVVNITETQREVVGRGRMRVEPHACAA